MSFAKSPLRRGRNGRAARTRFVEVEMEGYLRDRLGLTMADGKPPVRLLE